MADFGRGIGQQILRNGSRTQINGGAVIPAQWARAQPNRIQMFLSEMDQGAPVYEIKFPAKDEAGVDVTGPKYGVANGAEVTRLRDGVRCAVRTVDDPAFQEDPLLLVVFGVQEAD